MHRISSIFLIFYCFSMRAMYVPANTRYITPEEAELQVKKYYFHGFTAQEGLLKTLRDDEDKQVKIMLDFLGLDPEQAFNEIQRVKKVYKKLKPEEKEAHWHKNITPEAKQLLTQRLLKNNIAPISLIFDLLGNNEIKKGIMGQAIEPFYFTGNIENKILTIREISKPTPYKIQLAPVISGTVIDHELHHIKELHGIPHCILSAFYKSLQNGLDSQKYITLENNLILSQENSAEQHATIEQINNQKSQYDKYIQEVLIKNMENIKVTEHHKRWEENHLSPYEQFTAAINIIKLFEAEKKLLELNRSAYHKHHSKGLLTALIPSNNSIVA